MGIATITFASRAKTRNATTVANGCAMLVFGIDALPAIPNFVSPVVKEEKCWNVWMAKNTVKIVKANR